MGDDGLRFVDWLADAGQRWWQILPFGPPDRFGSPYSSASAFAGAPSWLGAPRAKVGVDDIERFVAAHPGWIGPWAAFAGRDALADQVRFDREWQRIRGHAHERGVRILGDMSFYVAAGSADHAARPELFRTGYVGGVPPDDWSVTGQRWGTPVYDWQAMRAQGYAWWVDRIRRSLELVDAVRIDHFRGFVAAWLIPEEQPTAIDGRWVRGPGARVFEAAQTALGPLPVVAENLGVITPAVEHLRHRFGMPGTIVLQFAFGGALVNPQSIDPDAANVVYTGTHDNDTTVGWWRTASEDERARVRRALSERGIVESEPHWMLTRLALASRAAVAMIPAQDIIGLGSRARINRPGRIRGNWKWQLEPGQLTRVLGRRLRAATEETQRG
jgi:4-alpha-glucanotransferase